MSDENIMYRTLKSKLRVCYLTGRKDEIVVRCCYCGDSVKNPNKGHMYIQNKPPYKYFCQKCSSKGYINEKFLKLLEIYDYGIVTHINKTYKDYQKKLSIKYGSDYTFFTKEIFFPKKIPFNQQFKIDYFKDRLGIDLTENDLAKYKIILNLDKFCEINNINLKRLVRKDDWKTQKKIKDFNDYCIGFLSMDKSIIAFRSLYPEKTGFRYANFSLFPEHESKKTYSIKNKIYTGKDVVDIVITEGVFDIIGVYNHLCNKDDSKLYFSNNGKSFLVTLNTIKEMGILNANVYIYSDADVTRDYYKQMVMHNTFLNFNGLNVFYNTIGKDYGVKKEEIKLSNMITF